MLIDFARQSDMDALGADVCIIGAGAAGITLARELLNKGHDVVLLESGGLDQEDELDDLMTGRVEGFPYYPLRESRLRFFGGTTSIWGGRCAQLDDIDFEQRSWVPYSGWPLNKTDLVPYYARAQESLDLVPVPGGESLWDVHGLQRPGFDPSTIATGFWQFDTRADRFAAANARDLFESTRVRVLIHATVTGIHARHDGHVIESVRFANLAGGRGEVRAHFVVVAAGGLENPRLLLASNDVHPDGLGNQHDLVGRFFMEHPHARGARVEAPHLGKLLRLLPRSYTRAGKRYAAVGRPSEALQSREGLLNSSFTISVRQHPGAEMVLGKKLLRQLKHSFRPSKPNRILWHAFRKSVLWSRDSLGTALSTLQARRRGYGVYIVVRAEQSPNPDSRVTLTGDRDALGMPRPSLQWRFQDIDKHTVKQTMWNLAAELKRLRLGRLELEPWLSDPTVPWKTDSLISNHPIGGYHHMGTTRMASSSREGVVDGDTRVFGVDNLYLAGSSVFTTSGWANPTLTILALSLRLADHLDSRLSHGAGH